MWREDDWFSRKRSRRSQLILVKGNWKVEVWEDPHGYLCGMFGCLGVLGNLVAQVR